MSQNNGKKSIVGSFTQETEHNEPVTSVVKPKKKAERRTATHNQSFTPSVKEKARKKAKDLNLSLNEAIHQLVEAWVEEDEK